MWRLSRRRRVQRACSSPGYSTIQSAITAATAGDTIAVCAGTYTEQLTITTNLTIKAVGSASLVSPLLTGQRHDHM